MVITSFAEVASIGAVLPFLGVLMTPERVFSHPNVQPIIVALGMTEAVQLLLPLTVIFILMALLSATMRVILLWAQTHLGFAIGADLGIHIYKKTLYQPYSVHVMRNSSEVIAGISIKVHSVIGAAVLPILTIISSGMILFAILFTLVVIEPLVALAVLVGLGTPYGVIMFATKKRLARNSQHINYESNRVIQALQEGLGGIRDVLIDGTQTTFCKIYRDADFSLRRSQANIQFVGGAPRFLIEFLGMTLIATLAYGLVGGEAEIANEIPVLGALAMGAQRLLPVFQQLYNSWTGIRGGKASLQDVLDLLDQPLPEHADAPPTDPIPFKESIRLNQIGFRYNLSSPWVVQGINMNIPKGSRIGIMGITGSGKSTLLDLIMGLLQPTQGVITIDDIPITLQNYRTWQAHIAHVPQSIYLADATIAENIAFGIPPEKIDRVRMKNAAHQSQIAATIEMWDKQYETFVGERGIRLSGGQRQRIGIARALYKQAGVIIFDEATSALDNDTERAVMEAVDYIGDDITILMVAHRLTTLRGCDQIFELANGGILRVGSYEQMIQSEGKY